MPVLSTKVDLTSELRRHGWCVDAVAELSERLSTLHFQFSMDICLAADFELLAWERSIDEFCSVSFDVNPIRLQRIRGGLVNLHVRSAWVTQRINTARLWECDQVAFPAESNVPAILCGVAVHSLCVLASGETGGAPWPLEPVDGGWIGIDEMFSAFGEHGNAFLSRFQDSAAVLDYLLNIESNRGTNRKRLGEPSSRDPLLFAALLSGAIGQSAALPSLLRDREQILISSCYRDSTLAGDPVRLQRRIGEVRCVTQRLLSLGNVDTSGAAP